MTHHLIEKWIDAQYELYTAKDNLDKAYCAAIKVPLPVNLRPAEPSDIVEDAIIWYPEHGQEGDDAYDDISYWSLVEIVHYPSDDWKAYTSNDGCRYGLNGAFVEV